MGPPFYRRTFSIILVLFHILTASYATQDDLIISTAHGKVQGKLISVLGGEVRAFLGIPYGKPPINNLRFRAPETVDNWKDVKDATKLPKSCYQTPDTTFPGFHGAEMWNPNTPLSEDCLYLNVWAPISNSTHPSSLAPVLVWIYGGGFVTGTSTLDIYQGHFLSKSEGVVVVSMNYRVGAFGFLSLPNNKNIQGNAGLLDQLLALKWVSNNIAKFGGDPKKVTLFGESAGSSSVGFHLLSPSSSVFFQRAIMQSGSPTAPWATISQNEVWDRSLMLAKVLGCQTSHPSSIETCLQKADAKKIEEKQYEINAKSQLLNFPFVPHVDGSFIPAEMESYRDQTFLHLAKKDLMIGVNKDEGSFVPLYGCPGFSLVGQSHITRNKFLECVNLALTSESNMTKEAVIHQYTDWFDKDNEIKNRDLMAHLLGDHMFVCPVMDFASRYAQNGGNTFFYYFDHRSSANPWPEWMGVMHGYEVEFVFGMPLNASLEYTKKEVNMTKKLLKHWANFARSGQPGIEGAPWPVFTTQQEYVTLNYNHIDQKMRIKPQECHLWNKLLPKLQNISDQLKSCVPGSGPILHLNIFLLVFLVIRSLTLLAE